MHDRPVYIAKRKHKEPPIKSPKQKNFIAYTDFDTIRHHPNSPVLPFGRRGRYYHYGGIIKHTQTNIIKAFYFLLIGLRTFSLKILVRREK